MSNNYLQYSESINNLTHEEVQWWKELQARQNAWDDPDNEDATLPEDEENRIEFSIENENTKPFVWFNAEECGNIEGVAYHVQEFLKKFRPNDYFTLTWAETCSKQKLGEFCGGGMFVSANEQKWVNPFHILQRHITEHDKKFPQKSP